MRDRRSNRRQRSVTPSLSHKKQGEDKHRDSQKRHMKKQQRILVWKRKLAMDVLKKKRERWAQIAVETQRIVLGDGKYVEKRNVSSDSLHMTVSAQGLGNHTIMPFMFQSVDIVHDISGQIQLSKQQTVSYPHYCGFLAFWATSRPTTSDHPPPATIIEFTQSSALSAARQLYTNYPHLHDHHNATLDTSRIGVLSFASPKRPGGGYLNGGDEQEEVIARTSSLVAALGSPQAAEFYQTHRQFKNEDGSGLHDHSMVYTPGVVVFRKEDDQLEEEQPLTSGPWKRNQATIADTLETSGAFIPPFLVNVVSAVPVNAAAVRQKYLFPPEEAKMYYDGIRHATRERMARILRLFEDKGDKAIILGAFGCGSSENDPEMIAEIWAELLLTGDRASDPDADKKRSGARFKDVFEKVIFAVPGKWHALFKQAFNLRIAEMVTEAALRGEES